MDRKLYMIAASVLSQNVLSQNFKCHIYFFHLAVYFHYKKPQLKRKQTTQFTLKTNNKLIMNVLVTFFFLSYGIFSSQHQFLSRT